jgi:hypothetical protein
MAAAGVVAASALVAETDGDAIRPAEIPHIQMCA